MHLFIYSIILVLLCLFNVFSNSKANPTYIKDDISVNCGSSEAFSGQEWIGDNKHPKFSLKGISTSSSVINNKLISGDPVIYKTARISHSLFSYSFHLNPCQKIIRLHFNPTQYKGFKRCDDFFTVEAGPFTLMSNFSASLTAQALGVNALTKEFYISLQENQPLDIVFSSANIPSQDRTYSFINGIEIITVPPHLNYFHCGDHGAQLVRQTSRVYIDNSTALEIIHRLNAKRESVMSGGEFDVIGMWGTVPKQKANEFSNLTWKRLVHMGFRYLIRIHFCELGLKVAETGHIMFKVIINEMIVDTNTDIVNERDEDSSSLWYRDYLVVMKGRKQDGQRNITISLKSNSDFIERHELLKGFEIFKLSNHDNSLAIPNALPPARNSHRKVLISVVAITMTILAGIISIHMLRQFSKASIQEENNPSARATRLCRCFSLFEMQSATRNFSDTFLLGRGGFGKVYKGVIDNGQTSVAIKRLKLNSKQGKHEFLTEIETLSELRHINVVSLIGYCNENKEMILVYEYMTSGTLADHLYKLARHNNNDNCNNTPLTWKQRLNICIGAGRGLDYLHTGHGIIHRDVKPSNILLDENFVAKVSDVGLAKPEDKSKLQSYVSTKVKGTFGYLDPHYFSTHRLTRKSDTYAFGVVLLQVLCGRPAMDPTVGENECCLTKWARIRINKGEVSQIIAPCLKGEISPDSLKVFVGVAESCLHDEPKKRPTMAQVVVQLELALEQHERVDGETSPSENEILLPMIPEQLTIASTYVQTNMPPDTEQTDSNTESAAGNAEGSKVKMYKPLRLWTWDVLWNRVKPSKKNELAIKTLSEICEAETKLQRFSFPSIAYATNQFSYANMVAHDEFGPVYMAVLPEGQIVTAKCYSSSTIMQNLDKFKQKIILRSNLQHQNVVRLLGYCIHGERMMLVYEFMANKNLYTYILDEVQRSLLHWTLRFNIIMGIARGIMYLHQESRKKIIHRDLNPSNILFDTQMNPKITGFGLATSSTDDKTKEFTPVRGNLGYLAPELLQFGEISVMSDVFSFGVLMLVTLTGKKNIQYYTHRSDLVSHAWELWNEGKALDLVDESLDGSFSKEEALRCIQVGLLCTQYQSRHRPAMNCVLNMLLGEVSSPDLHEKVVEASSSNAKYNQCDETASTSEYDSTLQSKLSPQRNEAIEQKKSEIGMRNLPARKLGMNDFGQCTERFTCNLENTPLLTQGSLHP